MINCHHHNIKNFFDKKSFQLVINPLLLLSKETKVATKKHYV